MSRRTPRIRTLQSRLVKKFEHFFGEEGAKHISPAAHVDYRVIGIVPLEIYKQTKEKRFLDFGQGLADKQWDKATERRDYRRGTLLDRRYVYDHGGADAGISGDRG